VNEIVLGDRDAVIDCIASQKQIASSYNAFAGECVSEQLRCDFLTILEDEHRIQADLFSQASNRGWYQVVQAESAQISRLKQKFPSGRQS